MRHRINLMPMKRVNIKKFCIHQLRWYINKTHFSRNLFFFFFFFFLGKNKIERQGKESDISWQNWTELSNYPLLHLACYEIIITSKRFKLLRLLPFHLLKSFTVSTFKTRPIPKVVNHCNHASNWRIINLTTKITIIKIDLHKTWIRHLFQVNFDDKN